MQELLNETKNRTGIYNSFQIRFMFQCIVVFAMLHLFLSCSNQDKNVIRNEEQIQIQLENVNLTIIRKGFRFSIQQKDGTTLVPAHSISGLQISDSSGHQLKIVNTKLISNTRNHCELLVIGENDLKTIVEIQSLKNAVKFAVVPQVKGKYDLLLRSNNIGRAFGMADHAAIRKTKSVELQNFIKEYDQPKTKGPIRMVSNFVIYPQEGVASINIDPYPKTIRITSEENAQGSNGVANMPAHYYFWGSTKEIYAAFLAARTREGYPLSQPKYEWFGLGWEAFGALSWNTNAKTVKDNINQYLQLGYPLDWMVVGSGFWPSGAAEFDKHGTPYSDKQKSEAVKKLQATTSFGMWDEKKYPNPKAFIDYFHQKGIIFTIGLRIGFIPGGPFTQEGLDNNYFIKNKKGAAELYKPGFPRVPVYILDAQNPAAVTWYVQLCDKWKEFGVDGFKEDIFHYPVSLRDDLLNPVNEALMNEGYYIMGRNNYLGSPVDIQRYDDFNYNHPQDRGPINGLAYAYSGFFNVYPDIIGGTGLATNRWGKEAKDKMEKYIIRYAQYASLNPTMAFGYGPWNFGKKVNELCLKSAQLHKRLHPYLYSNAIKSYQTGYPHTMTPLPIAFAQDEQVYGLANAQKRSYEWLIGDALLAAPLYGADYAEAIARDIYLPKGKWMDYETGEAFNGPILLENFSIPIDKTPLFVGGTGIIIEEMDGALKARVFPINKNTTTKFWAKDGVTQSQISLSVANWEELKVIDETTQQEIEVKKANHAFEFAFTAGHNYKIQ
jgi:hypothetical protein